MADKKLKKYFDILEISTDASVLEIRNAYLRLKKLYSTDSVVISPIADEFSKRERREIIQQIEEAFAKLMESLKDRGIASSDRGTRPASSNDSSEEETEDSSYSGPELKRIRRKLGIELFEVSLDTKIRMELLESIEEERFDVLPPEAYLRGHLNNYARYLLLNPKRVADTYIARYRSRKKGESEKD